MPSNEELKELYRRQAPLYQKIEVPIDIIWALTHSVEITDKSIHVHLVPRLRVGLQYLMDRYADIEPTELIKDANSEAIRLSILGRDNE